jgi:hypothetical protein
MSNEVLFTGLTVGFDKKPIYDCEVALTCNSGNYRLYVDKRPDDNHFYAHAVEFTSCDSGVDNIWECENLKVNSLFNITAYFDGVRHLEFNRSDEEMAGYIYYPNMDGLIKMMQKVREIELEICRDCD